MVDLSKYISKNLCCVLREKESKLFILEKIADLVCCNIKGALIEKTMVFSALQEREQLGSTGLTKGVALPHCRLEGVTDFILGLLVSPEGVTYGSLDGVKSRLFFFVIAPKEAGSDYLNLMAEIGSFLSDEERVRKLIDSKDSADLFETFSKLWEEYYHKEIHEE